MGWGAKDQIRFDWEKVAIDGLLQVEIGTMDWVFWGAGKCSEAVEG